MPNKNGYIKTIHKIIYALLPIIPLIAFLVTIDSFYTSILHDKAEYKQYIENLEKDREITLNTIIFNRIHQAKIQNIYIADELRDEFNSTYGNDVDEIKKEILSNNISVGILSTFGRVLIKDITISKLYDAIEPDHVLLFSNNFGIIELNTTFSRAHITEFKKWEEIMRKKINKNLTKHAIEKLTNGSEDVIFWESNYASSHIYDTTILSPSRKELDKMIKSHDLQIFHYYNLLIPTYISFGNKSNDFAIVREINLHRIIEPYVYSINQYTTMMESYRHDMLKIIYVKVITCILISLALFMSFVLAVLSTFSKIYETRGE